METAASFEARKAPSSYPTVAFEEIDLVRGAATGNVIDPVSGHLAESVQIHAVIRSVFAPFGEPSGASPT